MFGLDAPATCGRSAWIASGLLAALLSAPAVAQQPPASAPGQPDKQANAPSTRTFGPDAGLVLHFIKPEATADFEMVMTKVKEVLQKSAKPERKQQAMGWRLYKSPDPAGPNVLYVFVIDPALKGADYQVSNILAEGLPVAEVNELFKKYAAAYGTGQQPVNLALVNDFGK